MRGSGSTVATRRLVNEGQVREAFGWSHLPVYAWSLDAAGAGRARTLGVARRSVLLALVPAATLAIPLLVGLAHPTAGVWVAVVLGGCLLVPYLVGLVSRLRGDDTVGLRATSWTRSALLAGSLGCLVYLMAADASPVRAGFEPGPGEIGPADWAAYVAEQMASLVLFDLPRVLHLRLAPIRPSGGLALASMLAFRVLFALGLAEAAAELWRRWRAASNRFHASVPGAYVRCAQGIEGRLRREGVVKPTGMTWSVPVFLFLKRFHADAQRDGWTGFRDSPRPRS